eukprot:Pgem_evm2s128
MGCWYNSRRRITNWYHEYYSPLELEKWAFTNSHDDDDNDNTTIGNFDKILWRNAKIDVYYRACDRHPDDIYDSFVACYSFDCATSFVTLRDYAIIDGTMGHYQTEQYVPELNARTAEQLPEMVKALQDLPDANSECYYNEEKLSFNCECNGDTNWIHQEFIVSVPRPWSPQTHHYFAENTKKSIFTILLINKYTLHLPRSIIERICNYIVPVEYVPVKRLLRECIMSHPNAYRAEDNNRYDEYKLRRGLTDTIITKDASAKQKVIFTICNYMIGIDGDNVHSYVEDYEVDNSPTGIAGKEKLNAKVVWEYDHSNCYAKLLEKEPFYFLWKPRLNHANLETMLAQ